MHLAADVVRPTPRRGRCRVRVFEPEDPGETLDAAVVIVTEPKDNPGQSVTNSIGRVAAAVISDFGLDDAGFARPPIFVEHYEDGARGTPEDPHSFDLVTFSGLAVHAGFDGEGWHERVGEPEWKALDRASVERLVGRPLD